jgi:type II secretory pathway predicted ATPase ExeA
MFETFYAMSCNPFDKRFLTERDAFLSQDHQEALSRLEYLKDVRGVGLITAPPGFGKSFALRRFAKNLNPSLYQLAYICLSTVSVTEFYRQFCLALGLDISASKNAMFRAIQDRVYYLLKEKRQPFILAVDEAQYLNAAILRDLKILMNFGFDALNCFTIILLGEPYLNNILEKPIHEALRQRITIHYNFVGLSDQEIEDYIAHKLNVAGATINILAPNARSAIHSYCQGNPRLIDNLMTELLTLGSQLGQREIGAETVMAAINNQALH